MKLPRFRAIALLGLLVMAGLLTPREGAAVKKLSSDSDLAPVVTLGDPDGPGIGKVCPVLVEFGAGATMDGRVTLIARVWFISMSSSTCQRFRPVARPSRVAQR